MAYAREQGGRSTVRYQGGVHVPMCAEWPGRITADARNDRVALLMDLPPTICEADGPAANALGLRFRNGC